MPLVSMSAFPGREVLALVFGALAGIYFFCRGVILLRRRPALLSTSPSDEGPELHEPDTSPEVVRLSPVMEKPSSSIEMTSQARIAAALSRAGIAGPTAWTASPSIHAATGTAPAKAEHAHAAVEHVIIEPVAWKIGLMICGGPALTLTCLYLLAAQLGWL